MKYRCIVIPIELELELLECFLTINIVIFSAWATLLLSLMCLLQAQAAPADPPTEEVVPSEVMYLALDMVLLLAISSRVLGP